MVVTRDAELARRLRMFRNHGIDSDARDRQAAGQWHYEMLELGFNYRLSDIMCALGLSQLRRLAPNLARRRSIAAIYNRHFSDLPGVKLLRQREDVEHAWHLYPIRLERSLLRVGRKEVFAALRAEGMGINVHYIPVHLHPYYRKTLGTGPGMFPVAEGAYEELVSLPMYHGMSDDQVSKVVGAVTKVFNHFRR